MLLFQNTPVISPVSAQGTLHVYPSCSLTLLTLEILFGVCMSALGNCCAASRIFAFGVLNSSFAESFEEDSSHNISSRRAAYTIQFSIFGVADCVVGPDPQNVESSQGLTGRRAARLHLNRTASGQLLVGKLLFKQEEGDL